MKQAYKYHLLFILFLCVFHRGFGQPEQISFNHVDIYDGLSHNQVNCILKDDQGFMWFGTLSGLNRYDGYSFKVFRHDMGDSTSLCDSYITGIYKLPEGRLWVNTHKDPNIYNPNTERFNRDVTGYLKSLSLPDGNVSSVFEDEKHCFWFNYRGKGLYRYSPKTRKVTHLRYLSNNSESISDNNIADFTSLGDGTFWIVHRNGIIEKLDGRSLKVTYRNDSLLALNKGRAKAYRIFIDAQGDLWIHIEKEEKGLYYFSTDTKLFKHITTTTSPYHLNNMVVDAVAQDDQGLIWVGTDHGGVNILNTQKKTVRFLKHNPENERSLAQNSVYALYSDTLGIMWVGTYKKGICYYNEKLDQFPLFSHDANNPHTLPYNDVDCFVEDKKGNLWIGTNGGGLIYYNRNKNTYKRYLHDPKNSNSLCHNVIVSLLIDEKNDLWIGTYTGGLDRFDGKTFTHYRHINDDSTSLGNNRVWSVFEDSRKNIWVGTLGGGLQQFNRKTEEFIRHENANDLEGLSYIVALAEDQHQNLWVGTSFGVEVIHLPTGEIDYYNHEGDNKHSLSNSNIETIFSDSEGRVWIGTREGLNLFDPIEKDFQTFTTKDGLSNNTILTILEDNQHRLWMSTPEGISCLSISNKSGKPSYSFKNYNESDGLQGKEFNIKAALKTRGGKLVFGGPNGFNMFDPNKIKENKQIPPLAFTDLQIFNRRVAVGDTIYNQRILPKALSKTSSITLPHKANDFSIVFSSLGFVHTDKNKYAFKLKGFNEKWVTSKNNIHKVTYTNLDPGDYTLLVRASNNDGQWSKDSKKLQIKILPPFWLTVWAYLIYALVIVGILLLARWILLYRANMKFELASQQNEARRMHELDMMKIRFFTNISHEFRTPLSLIIAPVEKMLKQDQEKREDRGRQLKLVQRNAKRLLHLVNQLLDFRKMEVQELELNPVSSDIVRFIKEVVCSFTDLAEKKNIHFSLELRIKSLEADFDPEKLERILFNLLSNAFKFTHENGKITIFVDLVMLPTPENKEEQTFLQIRVQDNGIGIPSEKQKFIFQRFFRHKMPTTVVNPGSGIGLAITDAFVKLHHGSITVKSEPNKGSCFTVRLPVEHKMSIEKRDPDVLSLNNEPIGREGSRKRQRKKSTVLLIDDNGDFRFYLKDNLSVYYDMIACDNGKEGWEKALSEKPDLIVSDVRMPGELDGIKLSKKVKKDPRTAGIPVILLTAHASEEQRLEGFETGANAYITKPFNFEILLARIHNLLEEKKRIRRTQPDKVSLTPKEIDIPSEKEKFLKEAIELVEKNIDNPQFSVKELSKALFMSRVTLHKKISDITGKPPSLFIRKLRIKRAAQLIRDGDFNVSQAAYEVGYNNPKYFTKYFKEEFGVLPSEYGKEEA